MGYVIAFFWKTTRWYSTKSFFASIQMSKVIISFQNHGRLMFKHCLQINGVITVGLHRIDCTSSYYNRCYACVHELYLLDQNYQRVRRTYYLIINLIEGDSWGGVFYTSNLLAATIIFLVHYIDLCYYWLKTMRPSSHQMVTDDKAECESGREIDKDNTSEETTNKATYDVSYQKKPIQICFSGLRKQFSQLLIRAASNKSTRHFTGYKFKIIFHSASRIQS